MDKKAKKILLKTKKQVFGLLAGNNISAFKGEGFEFAELREYSIGDDVKKIDWKTTARLKKPFVKIYHEERELNIVISTMLSGSTLFGTKMMVKDFIIEILALLAFSAVRNKDNFSHILYANKLYRFSKPSKDIFAVHKEVEEAVKFDVLGKPANWEGWLDDLNKKVRKRSLMFLIGDFVGDFNLSLLAKKHDLVVIIVRDYFIENPKPLGEVRLVDPGYLDSFSGNVDEYAINLYKEALRQNDVKLFKHLRKIGARFAKLYTHKDAYYQLAKRI
ncbi:MAG: DUF58 domain-containing protein [Epsilonproteobacteria bacterium]|nr:DUF58 domain-containing protein [Campylobacterota bacterium]